MSRRALWLFAVVVLPAIPSACSSSKDPPPPTYFDRAAMMDPKTCEKCHADHYREWSGSMHAYAANDPVFLAMNARGQRETKGALGDFCVKCHAPMAVRTGATKDGLNLATVPDSLKGVTCFFCHTVDRVDGTHDAALHLSDELVMRSEIADPVSNAAHASTYSPLHDRDQPDSAKMCGACHDIVTPNGVELERTYKEWQGSVFSHVPGGATCGQCHMNQSKSLQPVAQAPGVFARRYHAHDFVGVDVSLTPGFPQMAEQKAAVKAQLDSTLQTALCVSRTARIAVIVDNVAAGHAFPSGASQDRRLWFELIAYKDGAQIFSSGVVPDGTPATKIVDPVQWMIRDCLVDDKGSEVHMFWQAFGYESNQLGAQLTFDPADPRYYQTHVLQWWPREATGSLPAMPDRVTMRVRLQPMGLEVLDELVASGDLDKKFRDAMPTFDLGVEPMLEWTPATAKDIFFDLGAPVSCITKTALNVGADKVPGKDHTKCKP